jgi:hypothetical protein
MSEPTCAVWYWVHGGIYVELCDTEEEAVWFALSLADSGNGAVAGVQHKDGSYVDRDAWAAIEEEDNRRMEACLEELRTAPPQPQPTRVAPPFDAKGATAPVHGLVPGWLGR